jgi:hypothetical protein
MCEVAHINLHTSTQKISQNLFQYESIMKMLFNLHVLHVKDNQYANLNNMHIQDR